MLRRFVRLFPPSICGGHDYSGRVNLNTQNLILFRNCVFLQLCASPTEEQYSTVGGHSGFNVVPLAPRSIIITQRRVGTRLQVSILTPFRNSADRLFITPYLDPQRRPDVRTVFFAELSIPPVYREGVDDACPASTASDVMVMTDTDFRLQEGFW
jgi:hypothetical protein